MKASTKFTSSHAAAVVNSFFILHSFFFLPPHSFFLFFFEWLLIQSQMNFFFPLVSDKSVEHSNQICSSSGCIGLGSMEGFWWLDFLMMVGRLTNRPTTLIVVVCCIGRGKKEKQMLCFE
jgi:hypothetical protein